MEGQIDSFLRKCYHKMNNSMIDQEERNMGTTMSYIQLKNRGFTREELQECLNVLCGEKEKGPSPLKDLERGMEALTGKALTEKDRTLLHFLHSLAGAETDKRPQIAFRADAPWLPFWQTWMCDGVIVSSGDLGELSKTFQTPVLAFALFDSDVLFASYRDNAAGAAYDYARLPFEEYEEYDSEVYQLGFPGFLADLCPPERREKLRQVWEEEDEDQVFADDRMWKLMELLGMEVMDPGAEQFPEEFEQIVLN